MPVISNFLKNNFQDTLQNDINNLIEELSMRAYFNNTIELLEDETFKKNDVAIAVMAASFLRSINYKLAKFKTVEEKMQRQRLFGILFERILLVFVKKHFKDLDNVFGAIEYALIITCKQHNYDYGLMCKLFDFQGLKHVIDNLKSQQNSSNESSLKKQRYVWTGKGNLPEFVDILLKNNYVKSKKELFDLFYKPDEFSELRWNKDKKYHLVVLLNKLFNEGFAKIEGNKGYFSYAEKHFTTYEKVTFAPNSLRKLSSSIFKNQDKFYKIINEVDEIIFTIQK
ncbi:MAG: hypothetical protein U0V72_08790 [Cytophagales bacterium]